MIPGIAPELAAAFRDATPQARPELLRGITDPRAAAWFAEQRPSAAWAPTFDVVIPELARGALLLMVKDEDDIIGQNLEHHYRLGFRRFFLLDNASSDRTAANVTEFRVRHPDAEVFYAYDFVTAYYQEVKMNALQAFAETYLCKAAPPLEWIFYVDADEFITCCAHDHAHATEAFRGVLADPGSEVMIFHWVQCASRQPLAEIKGHFPPEMIFGNRWRQMKPAVSKVAHRARHGLSTIQGNHTTRTFAYEVEQAAIMARFGFYMLHYPVRSLAQMRKKIVNGGRAYEAAPELIGLGNHWKSYYRLFLQHGDSLLSRLIQDHVRSCLDPGEAATPSD